MSSLIVETLIGSGISLYGLQQKKKAKIIADIKKHKNKDDYIKKLETYKFLPYYNFFLKKGLDYLTKNFGSPFSNASNNFTTNLAVFYSFAVFFIIWVFTGSGKMGNVDILETTIDPHLRFFYLIPSLIFIYLSYILIDDSYNGAFKRTKRSTFLLGCLVFIPYALVAISIPCQWVFHINIPDYLKSLMIILFASSLGGLILNRTFTQNSGSVIFAITFIFLVFGGSIFSTLFQFHSDPVKFFIMLGVTCILGYSVYFIKKKKGAGYVYILNILMVISYVLIIRFYPKILGKDILSTILIYFFVLMPSVNGVMDWVSLSISRILAKIILKSNNINTLILFAFLDLFIALILLCSLIFVFIVGTEFFNFLVVNNDIDKIPIVDLIEKTRIAPFSGSGLWVTIMLGSTLIPTCCLFLIASIAFSNYCMKPIRDYLVTKLNMKRVAPLTYNYLALYFVSVPIIGFIVTILITMILIYFILPFFAILLNYVSMLSLNIY